MGLIASRHGVLYAQEHGFDDSFEPLVAQILVDFLRTRRPQMERAWIAARGEHILGSIFCVRVSDDTAKLRLFYLEPAARGLGLGRKMLEACIGFARAAGYRRLVLWTHESHAAACSLYRKAGFAMVSESPVHNYGQDLVEQEWQIEL
ncbi:MAG: GNAT family N-acetyltransferase [Marinosulfonomonas sp.]|nr:GNAT family N-acetyltransferase [Marinosulfonomonas sp.]